MVDKLEAVPSAPCEFTVARIEELLEMARSGELRGFAAALSLKGGLTCETTCIGEGARVVPLLGALRILEREFIDKHIDLTCRDAGEGSRDL